MEKCRFSSPCSELKAPRTFLSGTQHPAPAEQLLHWDLYFFQTLTSTKLSSCPHDGNLHTSSKIGWNINSSTLPGLLTWQNLLLESFTIWWCNSVWPCHVAHLAGEENQEMLCQRSWLNSTETLGCCQTWEQERISLPYFVSILHVVKLTAKCMAAK